MSFRSLPFGIAAALVLLTACRDEKVTSYRVPKEPDPTLPAGETGDAGQSQAAPAGSPAAPPAPGASMANVPVPTASGPSLAWTAPSDWKAKPLGSMRKGSYSVGGEGSAGADLSITAFPGDVGGELANINRWRGQVGLGPLAAGQAEGAVVRVEANGLSITVVDCSGTDAANRQRILGAIVPAGGSTWFFKLMGADAVVGKEKTAFMEFLKTVRTP
jgi:hypothetical protein